MVLNLVVFLQSDLPKGKSFSKMIEMKEHYQA